ncbi:hypothetical protein BC941DRAFT_429482 [Chlamydoabsidia padenii]|nr:hypothetical protein BC941DRAFT_429482 [Chlamydoabsidia padenii]
MSLYLSTRLLYRPSQQRIIFCFTNRTKSRELPRSYSSSSLALLQNNTTQSKHLIPKSPLIKPRFRPGDWICPHCRFHNHAHRSKCGECSQQVDHTIRQAQRGDWICPHCEFYNFRQRLTCKRCEELRPSPREIQQQLRSSSQ